MPAKLVYRDKINIGPNEFVQFVIWEVDPSVAASHHAYKYRLAYVVDEICVIRYDNEAGKGDHKHIGAIEIKTTFTSVAKLLTDFWADIEKYEG
ncbi:toxin-antitoxin system TumE family protein [Yersinia mollaretii]|uniref:toxin-antitoxin system TumE family protein n=1 Tax=Yersinia mollaretii TaxID=33060 RepID=UPI0011A05403|nr:DUF6516 family protein [Yersinia mollaretii]